MAENNKSQSALKIPCVINGVDLTSVLPTPLWVTFTDKEKKAIEEFKKIVEKSIKPDHSDFYFSRFLVARKWDMKLSTQLFIDAMKVRDAEKIDDLLQTFPQNFWFNTITDYWPTSISSKKTHVTKDGCPVMYERIGLVNPKLADLIPMDILIQHHLYNVELMERENRKVVEANGFTAGTILIEDLEDLSTGHMYGKVQKLIQGIAARDEVSYPESIRKVYIVNPPGVFSLVWALMKPFIEERTQAKFAFGTSKEFKEEWDKVIGLENLPKYLGGSLDYDFPPGGPIKPFLPASLTTVEIPRRGCHTIECAVKKGQTFNVEFLLKSGKDIGFALYTKKGDPSTKKESITSPRAMDANAVVDEYKLKKIEEELTPYHAKFEATDDCTFVAFFDNSDSMMLGRDLTLHHYVRDPIVIDTKK